MSTKKLTAGMKVFDCSKTERYFHVDSAKPTPLNYPTHAESFKLLADLALDALSVGPDQPKYDRMIFAVLYGYRHALELRLKDLLRLGVRCGDIRREDVQKPLGRHPLDDLWQRVRPYLVKCYPTKGDELSAIDGVVQEFHNIDPDGQSIRYDRQTDGTRRTFDNFPSHIGVETLRNGMEAVLETLEFYYAGINDYEAERRQAYAEACQDAM
jgi:hypothetical protein